MRGEDRTSGALFSYVDVEARMGEPSAAGDAATDQRGAGRSRGEVFCALPGDRASLDCAGAVAARRAVAASLFAPLGAAAGRTDRVRHAVRWFVGLSIDEKVFDASTFSKTRDRLLTHEIAQEFLSSLLNLPEVKGLLSAEHFSVDGTLLKAWASMKSFRPKSASSEARGTARASRPRRGATARPTFARPSGRTRPTPRRPTRTPVFTAKALGRRAVWPISATP